MVGKNPASSIGNLMLRAFSAILIFMLFVAGCDEEYPFEAQNAVPADISGAYSVLDFTTADGCLRTYTSTYDDHTYTVRINGTQNLGGFAIKIMENDSEIPVDRLSSLYGIPISTSFFTKDVGFFTEHAFELWLASIGDGFFQRNSPKRVLWSFPLTAGKEWIVSETRIFPVIKNTRKVISANNTVQVPAGTFSNVYYVEDYFLFDDSLDNEEPPSKYWLEPGVGIVKYEYVDALINTAIVYELSEFNKP